MVLPSLAMLQVVASSANGTLLVENGLRAVERSVGWLRNMLVGVSWMGVNVSGNGTSFSVDDATCVIGGWYLTGDEYVRDCLFRWTGLAFSLDGFGDKGRAIRYVGE